MSEVCHIEYHTQPTLDTSHVIGSKFAHFIAHWTVVHVHLSDEVCQFSCVYLHRT